MCHHLQRLYRYANDELSTPPPDPFDSAVLQNLVVADRVEQVIVTAIPMSTPVQRLPRVSFHRQQSSATDIILYSALDEVLRHQVELYCTFHLSSATICAASRFYMYEV